MELVDPGYAGAVEEPKEVTEVSLAEFAELFADTSEDAQHHAHHEFDVVVEDGVVTGIAEHHAEV